MSESSEQPAPTVISIGAEGSEKKITSSLQQPGDSVEIQSKEYGITVKATLLPTPPTTEPDRA